jgi:ABC-type proline/glycine betaine transport system permease subunit
MALQVALLLILPYALPLLMPSWRLLLAYAVAVGCLLITWFAIWYHAVSTAQTNTGLEAIGIALAIPIGIATAWGTMVRTVTLIVRKRIAVVTVSTLGGILLPTAILIWANP